jgi:type IV fimbrial biogenesis protein FimT
MSVFHPTQAGIGGALWKLRRQSRGFTLIELMVTIAVIALIAAVASPAMITLMNSNRLSSTAGELTSAAQLARAEAIRRSAPVVLCGSDDGATCTAGADWQGWAVVGQNNRDAVEETVRGGLFPGNIQLSGPAGGVTFNSTGLIAAGTTLTACIPTDKPADNQRVITISVAGHVMTARNNGGGDCP